MSKRCLLKNGKGSALHELEQATLTEERELPWVSATSSYTTVKDKSTVYKGELITV